MLGRNARMLIGVAGGVAIASSVVVAQETTIVLRAARMFDGRDVRAPGVVVVRGAAIIAAGPAVPVPAGAQVIELGDATLFPGFIDAHTHLSGDVQR